MTKHLRGTGLPVADAGKSVTGNFARCGGQTPHEVATKASPGSRCRVGHSHPTDVETSWATSSHLAELQRLKYAKNGL
ncbi:MAG: hypothetical protein ACRDRA_05435 [Pseudonocardiaceae bacterium]